MLIKSNNCVDCELLADLHVLDYTIHEYFIAVVIVKKEKMMSVCIVLSVLLYAHCLEAGSDSSRSLSWRNGSQDSISNNYGTSSLGRAPSKKKPHFDPEREKKVCEGGVRSKYERDKQRFLLLYNMLLNKRYYQANFPFESARRQLEATIKLNKKVLQDVTLVTRLVERCIWSYSAPKSRKLPYLGKEVCRPVRDKPQSEECYVRMEDFVVQPIELQLVMSDIAAIFVKNGVNLSGLSDDFPPQKHADNCLSCSYLRNCWLDKCEAESAGKHDVQSDSWSITKR